MVIYEWKTRPSVETYISGLAAIESKMSSTQRRLLPAQYYAPQRTVISGQLAKLVGAKGTYQTINSQYGRLGHMFCDHTGLVVDKREIGTHRWWAVWSCGYATPEGFIWIMLPEVAKALEELKWVMPEKVHLPEEVPEEEKLIEGAGCRVTINAYERNPVARAKCIQYYGTTCVICGFDFEKMYGEFAKGYIHVHHLRAYTKTK